MSVNDDATTYSAFAKQRLIASGDREAMLRRAKAQLDRGVEHVLIFEDQTGRQVDFDFRGTPDEVVARATPHRSPVGPGRPKLGVVCREVSLLPRHWEWLEQQPNGISAALRRIVDEARKRAPDQERSRRARDAAAKIMWALAGDLPGFEEASRALYADDRPRFARLIRAWPKDVRAYLLRLTQELRTTAKRGEVSAG
jgi:hypothetical protein